jgi:hypothetical protein
MNLTTYMERKRKNPRKNTPPPPTPPPIKGITKSIKSKTIGLNESGRLF